MAATASPKKLARILAKSVSNASDNTDDALELLARFHVQTAAQLPAAGTIETTLIGVTPFAMRLLSANMGIQATQAKHANSRDYQITYDDGAAGSPVTLTTDLDGTATAVTKDVVNPLTVTAGKIIPAGSRVYLSSTVNACGAAADITLDAWFEYE
jgi:hypothetical protein